MGTASARAEPALRLLQLGAIAAVVAAGPWALFDLDRYSVPKELVLHLAACGASVLLLVHARRVTLSLADAALAGFLALSLASALLAVNHWLAFRAFGISLSGALAFWTSRALAREGYARALVTTLAAGIVLAAALALMQAYGIESRLFSERRAPGGTFGNRNFVAHFVTFGLPLLLLLALSARRGAGLAWATAGMALVAAVLVLSRSRAAWLGAGVCITFFAVEGYWRGRLGQDRRQRSRLVALGAAASAGVVLALLLPNTLEWRSDSPYLDSLLDVANYKEGSGHGRLIQYQNTLRIAADHPLFGVGPGNWPVAYPKYTFPGDPAFDPGDFIPTNPWPSSDWMAIVAERGLPALVFLLATGAALAIGAWQRWRRAPDTSEGLESFCGLLVLLALAVAGSFDAVVLLPAPTLYVGMALGALTQPAPRPVFERDLLDGGRRRLAGAVALTGLLLLIRSASQLGAMMLFDGGRTTSTLEWAARMDPGSYRMQMLLGYAARDRGRCTEVRRHAEAAHRLLPNHPAPRRLLAACRDGGRRTK
ncbi:MAG TPA: O-antigen ligase family protein [Gemmatimonadales bacterium]|nr:O-antigen ligase family protein [Gemmatimonadales bacterium]